MLQPPNRRLVPSARLPAPSDHRGPSEDGIRRVIEGMAGEIASKLEAAGGKDRPLAPLTRDLRRGLPRAKPDPHALEDQDGLRALAGEG